MFANINLICVVSLRIRHYFPFDKFYAKWKAFFAIEKMGMESRIRTGFSEGWGSDESELSSRREPKKQVGASIIPEF